MGTLFTVAQQNGASNAAIADSLETFASLLDLAEASTYTVRAYRRAAELIRETKAPIAELVRAGRVRELRGIGPGIEARLRELLETGRIAELDELESEVSPTRRARAVHRPRPQACGRDRARSQPAYRRGVPGGRGRGTAREGARNGPKTEAKLIAALAREERPRARRGLLLNRARALLEDIAERIGGEPAGDPRRWRDVNEELAVVCFGLDPEPLLEQFERLPQIVSVVERSERRATGVTVEGIPVELVAAEPGKLGTELLRATGSREYVEALEPLPASPDEEGVYRALGIPFCPPELRELPFRGKPPPLVELGEIRGDLHVHTTWSDGKATVLGWAPRPWPRPRVPGDLRPHAECPGRSRARCGRHPAPERGDRRGERAAGAVSNPARQRVRHPPGRIARPPRRRARRARLGAGKRPCGPACLRRRPDAANDGGDAPSCCEGDQPPEGPDHQPPPRERSRPRPGVRGRARDRSRARSERPSPAGSTCGTSMCDARSGPACRSSARLTRTRCVASKTCASRSRPPGEAGLPERTS